MKPETEKANRKYLKAAEGKSSRKSRRSILLISLVVIFFVLVFYQTAWNAPDSSPPDIRAFLESYFSTWSASDLKGYRSHFHEDARIYQINNRGIISSLDLNSFIAQQSIALARSPGSMYEKMTSFTADKDSRAASVTVQWELHKGSAVKTGIDRFILCREQKGNWKILALVFYGTPDSGR